MLIVTLYLLSLFDLPLLTLIRMAELGGHAIIEALLVENSNTND